MKKNTLISFVAIAFVVMMASCLKKEEVVDAVQLKLPSTPYEYANPTMPEHMRNEFMFNAPSVFALDSFNFFVDEVFNVGVNNPQITNDGATLGRVLFYDGKLSVNNTVACASCHKQEFAFADPTAGSKGFGGKITPRNSMAIVNVALNRNLFWDSRVHSASELTLKPVQNHIEMGMENLDALVQKLSNTEYYPELFSKAFGDAEVTEARISSALAQFLCSMISVDSRFDSNVSGHATFDQLETLGQELFFSERTKCSRCHSGNNFAADDRPGGEYGGDGGGAFFGDDVLFINGSGGIVPFINNGNTILGANMDNGPRGTANNGLDLAAADQGLENGQFRIPSLRNVALTAPYMHDGRFGTLEEVVEFYNSGVKLHPNLDKKLIGPDGEPLRLNLSSIEKKALVAFLEALTDQSLVKDKKFSNPFN